MAKKEKKLSEHSSEELRVKYEEACRDLFNLKNEYRLNRQLKKPHLLNYTKKQIARILTFAKIKQSQETKGEIK
ncbi:MAG: hypothetical protein S4CHLAM7_14130 [Chlamydiae bacterium]|nr:hypothetical protein [Chlamydiota bacterium]